MDTKLKNIKYNKWTKFFAFLLACVMFFVSGYSASMFLRGFFFYQSYAARNFVQTDAFKNNVDRVIWSVKEIALNGNITTYEEFLLTTEAKEIIEEKNSELAKIDAAYDLLDKSNISVYRTADNRYRYSLDYAGETYYFTYDGNPISYDEFESYDYISSIEGTVDVYENFTVFTYNEEIQTAVEYVTEAFSVEAETVTQPVLPSGQETSSVDEDYEIYRGQAYPSYIVKIQKALYFLNSIDNYTCYGEASRAAVRAIIEKNYTERLNNNYNNLISDVDYRRMALTARNNIRYAAINTVTGATITNGNNPKKGDTAQQVLEKLGVNENTPYYEYIENGLKNVHYKGGKRPDMTEGIWGELYELFIGVNPHQALDSAHNALDGKWNLYFAYVNDDGMPDSVTVQESVYNSFMNNSLNLPSNALIALGISFSLACAACIYLLCVAGKRSDGTVKLLFFDKVPLIVNLAVTLGVMVLCFAGAFFMLEGEEEIGWTPSFDMLDTILTTLMKGISEYTGIFVAVFFMIWTALSCSVARNIRNKTFWKHTLMRFVVKPFKWIGIKLKQAFVKIKALFVVDYTSNKARKKFRLVSAAVISGYILISFIISFLIAVCCSYGNEGWLLLLIPLAFVFHSAAFIYCIGVIVSLDRIMSGVSEIRIGKLTFKINTNHMPSFLRNFAKDIESIGEGLENAVESAVRDQKMKAELITNVSHDLKTPLTSIVNYVDLLKRCEVENEDAKKYISILDEKSQRMKKLIEDLVEASKASSGAIEIHPIKLNLCELAAQAVGEHTDELKNLGIEILLKTPQEPVYVNADAQKTSRIIENLFSNIRKYALENTRVYFEVIEEGAISLKNISKYPLDVPPQELLRRFVRGDASRTGEGSGLGLSIAQNLCELQGGRFGVYVDGDLFKVTVEFPLAQENNE